MKSELQWQGVFVQEPDGDWLSSPASDTVTLLPSSSLYMEECDNRHSLQSPGKGTRSKLWHCQLYPCNYGTLLKPVSIWLRHLPNQELSWLASWRRFMVMISFPFIETHRISRYVGVSLQYLAVPLENLGTQYSASKILNTQFHQPGQSYE